MINFSKKIESIVSSVKAKHFYNVLEYYNGNKKELEMVIQSKDSEDIKFNKYPAVILERPFTLKPTEWNNLDIVDAENLRILFVINAEIEERNDKRFSTKFEPILYPLVENFLAELDNYGNYNVISWTEHPYHGTKQKLSNDFLEVLELKINIQINKINC